jgi:uncharacterized protein YndB with AHSA1/START domain
MNDDRIEREVRIQAPPERVWAALTEAEHLGRWFGDAGAEVELRPGGRMTVTWLQHGTARALIEELDPPRRFVFRWALRPDEDPAPGNSTRVEFTITPEEEGRAARLRVVESGFAALAVPEEDRARHLRDNTAGWAAELAELASYLAPQTPRAV